MNVTQDLLKSSPHQVGRHQQQYLDCIESCFECASACWICADACLNEPNAAELNTCIRNTLSCAEICAATAKTLISQNENTDVLIHQLKACIQICENCVSECMKHSDMHEHCLICAQCCEACLKVCRLYVEDLGLREV